MKLKPTIFSLLLTICFLGVFSCSEDAAADLLGGAVPCGDYVNELDNISATSQAFSNDPSPETCEAYKNAMLDFYNEFKDCPFYEGSSYQETINEIQNMDCSEY